MFDALTDKFEAVFKRIRGEARLTEENIQTAMREVKMALLEADVNFKVVKDFTDHVRAKALGAEVLSQVRPGQMFIKIVHDELVEMMGGSIAAFEMPREKMATVLLLGLQGSGKTTFAGKLARWCQKQGWKPLLVGCDIYRPAAIEQLHVVARNIGVESFDLGTKTPAPKVAQEGVAEARRRGCNLTIIDTAGRLQLYIDEVKMDELQEIRRTIEPRYTFLVADAMTGQDAVTSASQFDEQVGIDGVCLTKLDGDARGGAALSIRAVTGKPIYFVGIGEKSDDLEPFHPDRMAQRILGMGDVLTLVEKAQETFDAAQAEEMQKKLKKEQFTLQDFLDQMKQVKKMGSMKGLLSMIPGLGQQLKGMDIPDDAMKPMEGMILSMTPDERARPELIDGSRRKRIAKGSGTTVPDLNAMIKEFQASRKMMSQMMQAMGGGGKMGMLKGLLGGGGMPAMPSDGGAMPALPRPHGGGGGGDMGQKMKPKHRRKRDTKKKKK